MSTVHDRVSELRRQRDAHDRAVALRIADFIEDATRIDPCGAWPSVAEIASKFPDASPLERFA